MKLGELKIECLMVMDADADDISMDNLATYENNDSYSDYMRKMPGAINRGLDRMATLKKLPIKEHILTNGKKEGAYLVFNLKEVPNFRSIKRVRVLQGEHLINNIDYLYEGKHLMIPNIYDGEITLYYYPSSPAVTREMGNEEEIDIPDELARLLPYYVKSDIFETEEPSLASQARNKFESALEEITLNEEDSFDCTINKVYRMDI